MKSKMTNEPYDRLTHLSVDMTKPLERPENADVKAIVFLADDDRGGIQIHGYEGDQAGLEAMVDLMIHMKAVFEAHGKTLQVISMDEDGVRRA